MSSVLWIPHLLPAANQVLKSARRVSLRKGRGGGTYLASAYDGEKRAWTETVARYARAARVPRAVGRVTIAFTWVESTQARAAGHGRDPGNVRAAEKSIVDGLTDRWGAGILHCDGAHCIAGFGGDRFLYRASVLGVLVCIRPECLHRDLIQPGDVEACVACGCAAPFLCLCGVRLCESCAPDGPPPWRIVAPEAA